MGTSGGDRDELKALVRSRAAEGHGAHAVVAPQMGKQVAAFGAVVDMLGKSFPGAFAGYKLEVSVRARACVRAWVRVLEGFLPSSVGGTAQCSAARHMRGWCM